MDQQQSAEHARPSRPGQHDTRQPNRNGGILRTVGVRGPRQRRDPRTSRGTAAPGTRRSP